MQVIIKEQASIKFDYTTEGISVNVRIHNEEYCVPLKEHRRLFEGSYFVI